jgi:magnesium-transporting ATPase (P-type)
VTSSANGSNTPPDAGLTSEEAQQRLEQFGPNQPGGDRGTHSLLELFGLFTNPLALVLIGAAGVSAWVGDVTGAGIIIAIVLIGAGINFTQTLYCAPKTGRVGEWK